MIIRPRDIISHGRIRLILAASMVLLVAQAWAAGTFVRRPYPSAQQPRYAANQVLITLRSGRTEADLAPLNAEYGSQIERKLANGNTYLIDLPGDGSPAVTFVGNELDIIKKYPAIEDVQLNYAYHLMVAPDTDPYFPASYQTDTTDGKVKLYGQWPYQPDPLDPTIQHIHATEAWELEKGSSDVVVAVLDSGIRTKVITDPNNGTVAIRRPHPDLVNRLILDPAIVTVNVGGQVYAIPPDLVSRDFDPSPSESAVNGAVEAHGTMCAGIIGAQGNNNIGIVGLCWDGVRILPVRVADDSGSVWDSDLADALEYVIRYRDTQLSSTGEPLRVNVVNMSFGGQQMESPVVVSAIQRAAASGIVMVAAAGNDWEVGAYPPAYPGALDEVISVGCTDHRDVISTFSQRGRALDIVAPGEEICSTAWSKSIAPAYSGDTGNEGGTGGGENPPPSGGGGEQPPITPPGSSSASIQGIVDPAFPDTAGNYIAEFQSGTSFSTPVVSAAAALLMSHGVPAGDVRELLLSTATPIGYGRPNDTYGWGMLNIRRALEKASIDVQIQTPVKSSIVTNPRPRFRIDFRHALKSSIQVWLDRGTANEVQIIGGLGGRIQNWDSMYYTLDAAAGKTYLLFDFPVSAGTHTVTASAQSDMNLSTVLTAEDTNRFTARAESLSAGWHMFSVPYILDSGVAPSAVIGTTSQLWRYAYADGRNGTYSAYSASGRADNEATFQPNSVIGNVLVHPTDRSVATPPAGLGYWLKVRSGGLDLPALDPTVATEVGGAPYAIGLYNGWNMVGCPYPSPTPWAGTVFDFGGLRMTAQEAVMQGWISNYIYSYDAIKQSYTTAPVSTAVMQPWESQWVRVRVNKPDLVGSSYLQLFNPSFQKGFDAAGAPNCSGFVGSNWSAFSTSGNAYFSVGTTGVSDTSSQKVMPLGQNPGFFSAGIYQVVSVVPGERYTFSAWTKRLKDCTGVVGTCKWPVGEGTQIGIDPSGGLDPMDAGVIWSSNVEGLVGEWTQQIAYAQAQAAQITVFVRVIANAPATDRAVFIDGAAISGGHDVTMIVNPGYTTDPM